MVGHEAHVTMRLGVMGTNWRYGNYIPKSSLRTQGEAAAASIDDPRLSLCRLY